MTVHGLYSLGTSFILHWTLNQEGAMNWNDATNDFLSMSSGVKAHAGYQGKSYFVAGVILTPINAKILPFILLDLFYFLPTS
jgi:hypothetical protein